MSRIGGVHLPGLLAGFGRGHPHVAQGAHGWQVGKPVDLETLHPSAFMIDTNQQVGAHLPDGAAQRGELGAVFPVAGKQNQTTHQQDKASDPL